MANNPTPAAPKKRGRPPKADTWRPLFLQALRNSGNVRAASGAAGIDRDTAYRHRHRSQEFAKEWDAALDDACDVLEAEAWRRAVRGTEEPVHYLGQQVGSVKKYSDVLLIFLLKAHRPMKFRDRVQVDLTVRREQLIAAAREEGMGEAAAVAFVEEYLKAYA